MIRYGQNTNAYLISIMRYDVNFLLIKVNMETCNLGSRISITTNLHLIKSTYLRKITGTGQVQDVHILVDILTIEPSKNEYPTIREKRNVISSR